LNRFVLDCSIAMAWCFDDENDCLAESVLTSLLTSEGLVPAIWPLEVANVLLVGERRGRLKRADTHRFIGYLRALPIVVDEETTQRALNDILSLARQCKLSAYDAAYLELAMRKAIPLATLDERIKAVAKNSGVALISA
jgi:predicted nucleic acid-binding protein